jgi:hypothetical protein
MFKQVRRSDERSTIANQHKGRKGIRKNTELLWVVALLLFGFLLRVTDIAAEPLRWDEANTDYLAFQLGHDGFRETLGVRASVGVRQSPFFHDVFWVSFAFDPDPRIARLFLATIHLVSMAMLYLLIRRYFTVQAALITLLLYAVMPRAIWSARYIWNPSLTLPFIIGFYLTGLLASDKNGKRWARWLTPILLCCAFQAHPIALLAGAVFPFFFIRDWLNTHFHRKRLLIDYAVGFAISGVLLIPWIYGTLMPTTQDPPPFGFLPNGGFAEMIALLVNNPVLLVYRPNSPPMYIPMTAEQSTIFQAIGWFAILASFYAMVMGILRRHFAMFMIGAAFILPPIVALLLPRSFDHYFIPVLPATAIVLAIVLVGGLPRRAWLTGLGVLGALALCIAQVPYFFSWLQIYDSQTTYNYDWQPPLRTVTAFRDAAIRPETETIYYIFGQADGRPYDEYFRTWRILAARSQSRVISGDSYAFPVPKAGATIISYLPDFVIPPEIRSRPPRLVLGNYLQARDLPPDSELNPTCPAQPPAQLANGATILGYYIPAESDFQPGTPWQIYILWRSKQNNERKDYQIFAHLVDDQGKRYAQFDGPTLHTDLWHDDEMLISKIALNIPGDLPLDARLSLRTGMYTLPYTGAVPVVEAGENSADAWVTIPVCATSVPAVF